MKDNFFFKFILILLFFFSFLSSVKAQDQFNFDVTEIEIYNNGNLYKGLKRGIITTNDGIIIKADLFTYNKITNIVDAEGNVKVEDVVNNYVIFSDTAKYKKMKKSFLLKEIQKGLMTKIEPLHQTNLRIIKLQILLMQKEM